MLFDPEQLGEDLGGQETLNQVETTGDYNLVHIKIGTLVLECRHTHQTIKKYHFPSVLCSAKEVKMP